MSNKLGSGFCALCGKEVPVVDGSVAAPVYGGELLSPQAVYEMGENIIYSPVHAHCLDEVLEMGVTKETEESFAVAPSEAIGWEWIDNRRSGDPGRIHALKSNGWPLCHEMPMAMDAQTRTMGLNEFLSHDAGCKFCKRILGT